MSYNLATTGLGCTVSYSTTSGGTYTTVGQLRGIDGTNSEVAMFDSTGLSSTSGEQVPTLFRAGEFGFKVLFDPDNTTHASGSTSLHAYHAAKTVLYWKLTFPTPIAPGSVASNGAVYSFAAYVKSFATSGFEVEGGIEAQIGLAITGDVTWT